MQLAQDGAGQLAAGQPGQAGRPQLGLGFDRRGLLGRDETEERALTDGYVAGLLAGAIIVAAGALVALLTINARVSGAEAAGR